MSANLCTPNIVAMLGIQMCKEHPDLSMENITDIVTLIATGSFNSITAKYKLDEINTAEENAEVFALYLNECKDAISPEEAVADAITLDQVIGAANYASYQICESTSRGSIASLNICSYLAASATAELLSSESTPLVNAENARLFKKEADDSVKFVLPGGIESFSLPISKNFTPLSDALNSLSVLERVHVLLRPSIAYKYAQNKEFILNVEGYMEIDRHIDRNSLDQTMLTNYLSYMEKNINYTASMQKMTHASLHALTAEVLSLKSLLETKEEFKIQPVRELPNYRGKFEIACHSTALNNAFYSHGLQSLTEGVNASMSWFKEKCSFETCWGYDPAGAEDVETMSCGVE